MADVFNPSERSAVMRAVKSSQHDAGDRRAPRGPRPRPALPPQPPRPARQARPRLPSRKAVVFVHGCFWHGHDCPRGARMPATNRDYWLAKIGRNVARDKATLAALKQLGWKTHVIWECETRDKEKLARLLARKLKKAANLTPWNGLPCSVGERRSVRIFAMLHASTQKLIIKLCELTEAGHIAWKRGEGQTFRFETEGYVVEVQAGPPRFACSIPTAANSNAPTNPISPPSPGPMAPARSPRTSPCWPPAPTASPAAPNSPSRGFSLLSPPRRKPRRSTLLRRIQTSSRTRSAARAAHDARTAAQPDRFRHRHRPRPRPSKPTCLALPSRPRPAPEPVIIESETTAIVGDPEAAEEVVAEAAEELPKLRLRKRRPPSPHPSSSKPRQSRSSRRPAGRAACRQFRPAPPPNHPSAGRHLRRDAILRQVERPYPPRRGQPRRKPTRPARSSPASTR